MAEIQDLETAEISSAYDGLCDDASWIHEVLNLPITTPSEECRHTGEADPTVVGDTCLSLECDVVIAGCGVAGLYAALNLPHDMRIIMLTKTSVEECDSMLAQGGICVMHDEDDYESFYEDTMRAGHYENRSDSVDIMIRSSRAVIDDLLRRGVDFERDETGQLVYTREGAHSRARICFHADITGQEITTTLLDQVRALPNVHILEQVEVVDIIESDQAVSSKQRNGDVVSEVSSCSCRRCEGVVCIDRRGVVAGQVPSGQYDDKYSEQHLIVKAPYTILATGGIGGLYKRSTNFASLTGDACRIAYRHGIELEHMDYVQIHPTSLYTKQAGRAFLISESCRGEGAVLLDAHGERFVDELQPRDVVAKAIFDQMIRDKTEYVMLSFEALEEEEILSHFANIYERCLSEGYDLLREPIPVVPAQHYFMGGIHVDTDSQTSLKHLFAVGETSCNGVHGKNRLASNSLLESLVFARRAALHIAQDWHCPSGAGLYTSKGN